MDKQFDQMSFGKLIRKKRKERGWTLLELARKVDLQTAQSISNWESGASIPRTKQLKKLSKALSIDINDLINLTDRERIQDELIQDTSSFADLMYLMGPQSKNHSTFYIICQRTLTLENPLLATTIARMAWEGTDVVYIYLQSSLDIWQHNMDSAFDGFDLSLTQLSRELIKERPGEDYGYMIEAAQKRILRFDKCLDRDELGIKHAAMISPFLTVIFRCSSKREGDLLWFALPKEKGSPVWHKLPYAISQIYRSWIIHDLRITEPYCASSITNNSHLKSLKDIIIEREP